MVLRGDVSDLLVVHVAATLVSEDLALVVQEVAGADLVCHGVCCCRVTCGVCGGRGAVQEGQVADFQGDGAVFDELLDFFTVLLLKLCTVHAVVVLEDGHANGLAVLGCLFSGLHARRQGVDCCCGSVDHGGHGGGRGCELLEVAGLLGGGVLDDAILGQHNATVFVGAGGHRAAFCYLGVLVAVDYDEADDTYDDEDHGEYAELEPAAACLAGALLGLLGRNLAGFFAGVGRHACSFGWEYGWRFVHFF